MDLDDQQQFKHGIKTLVACADIVRAEIQTHPFKEETAEEMLLIYWRAFVAHMFAPNIGDMLKNMLPQSDD